MFDETDDLGVPCFRLLPGLFIGTLTEPFRFETQNGFSFYGRNVQVLPQVVEPQDTTFLCGLEWTVTFSSGPGTAGFAEDEFAVDPAQIAVALRAQWHGEQGPLLVNGGTNAFFLSDEYLLECRWTKPKNTLFRKRKRWVAEIVSRNGHMLKLGDRAFLNGS